MNNNFISYDGYPNPLLIRKFLNGLRQDSLKDALLSLTTGDNLLAFVEGFMDYPDWHSAFKDHEGELTEEGLATIKFVKENKVDFFKLIVELFCSGAIKVLPITMVAIGNLLYDEENIVEIVDSYPDDLKDDEEISIYETDVADVENEILKMAILAYKSKVPRKN
ncbi:MAG: hypothetical protein P8179_21770 [Candidatus Thiodiazotropha sp.]